MKIKNSPIKMVLFLVLLLIPFVGLGDEPHILLQKENGCLDEDQRYQGTVSFSAELLSNGSIKVLSSKITTFTVKICNASTGAILYQESTVEGVLHITTHFWQAGRYVLQIETADASYSGEFDI